MRKIMSLVIVLLVVGAGTVGAIRYISEDSTRPISLLGRELYYIDGNADYAVVYPTPGDVKLLEKGHGSSIIPAVLRIPRKEWDKIREPSALFSRPTPLVFYLRKDGKFGVTSLIRPYLDLDKAPVLMDFSKPFNATPEVLSRSCPKDYIDFGGRFCPYRGWRQQLLSNGKRTLVTLKTPVMGAHIDGDAVQEINYIHWRLVINSYTYAQWAVSLEILGVPIVTLANGSNYNGFSLDVNTKPGLDELLLSPDQVWSNYLYLDVQYEVLAGEIPAYDKVEKKRTQIPYVAVYPLKILNSGKYQYTFKKDGSVDLYIKSGKNPPTILNYLSYTFPVSNNTNKPWPHLELERLPYPYSHDGFYVADDWGDKEKSSPSSTGFSIPVGGLLASALEDGASGLAQAIGKSATKEGLLELLKGISLSFSNKWNSYGVTVWDYKIQVKPRSGGLIYKWYSDLRTEDMKGLRLPIMMVEVRPLEQPTVPGVPCGLIACPINGSGEVP